MRRQLSNIMANHPQSKPKAKAPAEAEIRKHYYLERYVIIAPKRNLRPDSFSHQTEPHKIPNLSCHFCNNTETSLYAFPGPRHWQIKVIANAFPALSLHNPK